MKLSIVGLLKKLSKKSWLKIVIFLSIFTYSFRQKLEIFILKFQSLHFSYHLFHVEFNSLTNCVQWYRTCTNLFSICLLNKSIEWIEVYRIRILCLKIDFFKVNSFYWISDKRAIDILSPSPFRNSVWHKSTNNDAK